MKDLLLIFISSVLINNLVLTRYLGLCIYMGVSRKVEPSLGMGAALVFVMGTSSIFCWLIYRLVLVPLNLTYLKVIVFVLIISSFVQLVETTVKKMNPRLYRALGVYLILIASNCAVLAPPLLNVDKGYDLIQSVVNSLGCGAGFALALIIMSHMRERLELAEVPEPLRGMPIAFILTGLIALAFLGFQAMIKI